MQALLLPGKNFGLAIPKMLPVLLCLRSVLQYVQCVAACCSVKRTKDFVVEAAKV